MLVVTTPTGQIGRHVVAQLVAAGEPVRVVARDRSRLASDLLGQVEVVEGSHGDPATLARALDGAEAIFHCIPPDYRAADVREYYLGFARALAAALPGSSVGRVVFVSSGGRGRSEHAGVVGISHEVEELLEATGVAVRSLRCGTFMENMLHQVELIRHRGMIVTPIAGDVAVPLVATRDIGVRAAELLCDRSWTGQAGTAVYGPADLSYDAMAEVLARLLARPVRFQEVAGPDYVAQTIEHGGSESVARALLAMFVEMGRGLYDADPRTPEATTPTTFEAWSRANLVPLLA